MGAGSLRRTASLLLASTPRMAFDVRSSSHCLHQLVFLSVCVPLSWTESSFKAQVQVPLQVKHVSGQMDRQLMGFIKFMPG